MEHEEAADWMAARRRAALQDTMASLHRLLWSGMAAIGVVLVATAYFGQTGVEFGTWSRLFLASGLLVLAGSVVAAAAKVFAAVDMPIGADLGVLARLVLDGLDGESLMASRKELARRMLAYNEASLQRVAPWLQASKRLMLVGGVMIMLSYVLALGGMRP